jgi:hypothetical protein
MAMRKNDTLLLPLNDPNDPDDDQAVKPHTVLIQTTSKQR